MRITSPDKIKRPDLKSRCQPVYYINSLPGAKRSLKHFSGAVNTPCHHSLLALDPVIQEWSGRPEYQEIIDRNNEQVQRQQALYLAGVKARDETEEKHDETTGY